MEMLQKLEQRVNDLISMIKQLRVENARLVEENYQLLERITKLHGEELNQERIRFFVDDLIKSIDSLMSTEKQS